MVDLKQAILDIIKECYGKCYIGPLRIREMPGGGWDVQLGFQNDERPIHIAAQLDIDSFLKYFREEIRHRHLAHDHFYTGYTKYPEGEPRPINKTEHAKVDYLTR